MWPALNIGPFVFPTAGLVIILGAWVCLSVVEQTAVYRHLNRELLYGLASTALLAGVIGARLTFVALYWSAYQNNLLGILWPLNTGFNMGGGLVFGLAAAFFYGRSHQLPIASTLDTLTPALLTATIVISLADFLAGPGYGTLTSVPWGLNQFGVRRHPVQLYEILLALETLFIWRQLSKRPTPPGQLLLVTTAVYALGRLFLDTFRGNAWLSASGWHLLQLVVLAIALLCLLLLAKNIPNSPPS